MSENLNFEKLKISEKQFFIQKLNQLNDFSEIEESRAKEILLYNPFKNSDEFSIKINNEIIGFTIYQINSKNLYRVWTFILKEFRNKGYGSKVLEFIENIAKEKKLETIYCRIKIDNRISQNFYFDKGYRELKNENDEIIFIKYL